MAEIPVEDLRDLERHLASLRPDLARLADDQDSLQDGHYRPADEEALQPLWASLWRGRLALMGILEEGRWRADRAAFLRGFAAMLVLVANARWLRDALHGNRLLRRVVNQAVPALGIPAGSYDAIQVNLLKARNLRGMSTALDRYRALAPDAPREAIHDFIEDRLGALQVPGRRLLRGYLRTVGRRLGIRLGRRGVARACYALQRWVGSQTAEVMTRLDHEPALPEEVRRRLGACLRPGDVLITRKEHCLTNHLLPGYWPHAILYLGPDVLVGAAGVIEAQRDGVRLRPIASVHHNDGLVVLRPTCSPAGVATALGRARTHLDKPYDFDFDFRTSERLVCTEVVYRSYDGIEGIGFRLTARLGRPSLSAEDLLRQARDDGSFAFCAVRLPDGPWLEGDVARETTLATFA